MCIRDSRTVEDLLKNNKTCPEESIYQIGTMGESVSPDTLFSIVNEFYQEFERRFGSHIHILDWALHLDEGTPHIHERHVFDCENRYGELCPQQEKALEELGIPLPNPEKPKGRNNNRKQTFDAVCRTIPVSYTHLPCVLRRLAPTESPCLVWKPLSLSTSSTRPQRTAWAIPSSPD